MGHSIHAEVMLVLSFYIIAPGGVKLRLTGFAEAPLPAELSFQPSVLLFKIYFIYLGVYIYIFVCVYAHLCVDALRGQRRASIIRSWGYRQFWAV